MDQLFLPEIDFLQKKLLNCSGQFHECRHLLWATRLILFKTFATFSYINLVLPNKSLLVGHGVSQLSFLRIPG